MRRLWLIPVVVYAAATVPAFGAPQNAPIPFQSGQGVTPSFEGWFRNPDGTIFTVVVPKDFPPNQKVTWTIVAHGQTAPVPGHLRAEWEIDALKESTSGKTPPVLRFESGGKALRC